MSPEASIDVPRLEERPDGVKTIPAERAASFIGLMRAAQHLERRLDAGLRQAHGVGLRVFSILLHLAAFAPDGRLRIGQLAQRAALVQPPLSPSRLSRLVAELEGEGLVRRAACEDDSRAVEVSITPDGLDKLRRIQDTHYRMLEELFFGRLDEGELAQLAAITAKLDADADAC